MPSARRFWPRCAPKHARQRRKKRRTRQRCLWMMNKKTNQTSSTSSSPLLCPTFFFDLDVFSPSSSTNKHFDPKIYNEHTLHHQHHHAYIMPKTQTTHTLIHLCFFAFLVFRTTTPYFIEMEPIDLEESHTHTRSLATN